MTLSRNDYNTLEKGLDTSQCTCQTSVRYMLHESKLGGAHGVG